MPTIGVNVSVVVIYMPTMYIIDIAVAVIINSIVRNFTIIHPEISFQIGMIGIETVINDGHHDFISIGIPATGGNVPGFVCINVLVIFLIILPLLRKHRVVGNISECNGMIELSINDGRVVVHLDRKSVV